MNNRETIQRLRLLRMGVMAQLHKQHLETNRMTETTPDRYLWLLVDRQWADREGRKMECLLHDAGFGIQATLLVITDRIWCVLSCNFIPRLRSLGFVQYWGNVLIPGLSGQVKRCLSGVQKMGYVSFSSDKTYYSVPYRFIGYRTEIHYTDDLVEVYYKHERIAFDQRQKVSGKYITNKAHLTKAHQHYRDWAPTDFIQQAGEYGDDLVLFVQHVLRSFRDPKVGYQRMKKLFRLASWHGKSRWNVACKLAYQQPTTWYHKVVGVLERNPDWQSKAMDSEDILVPPIHKGIKGNNGPLQKNKFFIIGYE